MVGAYKQPVHVLSEALPLLEPDVCYVITVQHPTVKRTTTGYFVTHDDEKLTLLDQKGKFRHVDIDKIIRINYYWEGRAPFERD